MNDRARCWWAESDPLLVQYHNEECGRSVADDARLFEMLCLEGFGAGIGPSFRLVVDMGT